MPSFFPGQYCYLINPTYLNSDEPHPFSIASSPLEGNYMEFCIKVYGSWTREFVRKKAGDKVCISHPTGNFTWNQKISNAAFLLGGIGIAPIISMLRFIAQSDKQPASITMLYGNRTPDTIAYKKELEALQDKITDFRIIHIFSHLLSSFPWNGYRGFIKKDIIEKEINLTSKPTFFMVGPPIFLQKMQAILTALSIQQNNIRTEDLSGNNQGNFLVTP